MRGGRALRKAPLVALFILLSTCNLNLKVNEPSLEVEVEAAYASADNLLVRYKFTVEEPVLRCRYIVNKGGEEIFGGVTGILTAGEWHEQLLVLPDPVENGRYELRIVIQAERSGGFVDLAFLDETREFYFDDKPPVGPPTPGGATTFMAGYMHVYLTHPELTAPQASPVNIHYTLDNTNPTISSTEYNISTGIVRPVSNFDLPLQAAAFDLAGNSGPVFTQSQICPDSEAPATPIVDLSDLQRFTESQVVTLWNSELTNPMGSPVTLFYTLDGSDPITEGSPNNGTPIPLPFNKEIIQFRCVAKDAAGHQSAEIQKFYRFFQMNEPTEPALAGRVLTIIRVKGFGLQMITKSDIAMWDSDGTLVNIPFQPNTDPAEGKFVEFVASLNAPGIDLGTAIIRFSIIDPGPISDTVTFQITE